MTVNIENALADCLAALADQFYCERPHMSFQRIADRSYICRNDARRVVRLLAKQGYAEFGSGQCFDGVAKGWAGYRCTKKGFDLSCMSLAKQRQVLAHECLAKTGDAKRAGSHARGNGFVNSLASVSNEQ